MAIGKRKGKVVKGAGQPGAPGGDAIGGSLSKNDHWYLQQGFGFRDDPGASPFIPGGHTASGGTISDYSTPPGAIYRAHIFTATGTFNISSLGPAYPATVEYLVVAGGGGGYGGGGGAVDIDQVLQEKVLVEEVV